ncbi:MAG: class I SAM-dependent methyltransferase [Verrucomicrobiota bacterium]
MAPTFDTIAPAYTLLERLTFGTALQNARTAGLYQVTGHIQKALLIGDGNGQFATELLRRHPECTIDSIDQSRKMLTISQRRIEKTINLSANQFQPICADIRSCEIKKNYYDFVGLHFVLDCFNDEDCERVIERVIQALQLGGKLSYADFAIPEKQLPAWFARTSIYLLYQVFRIFAGLNARRLPQFNWPTTLAPIHQSQQLQGLLECQLFEKS